MKYSRKLFTLLFVKKVDPAQATSLNLSLVVCTKFLVEGLNYL